MAHIYNPVDAVPLPDPRPPPRKRRRVVISCFECHRRKQKCDRQLPCSNCVTRNKGHGCSYEAEAPTLKSHLSPSDQQPIKNSPSSSSSVTDIINICNPSPPVRSSPARRSSPSLASMAADLGYGNTATSSTMCLLQSIQTAPNDANGSSVATEYPHSRSQDTAITRERYKSLVRQLPSKLYIDKLVDIFYQEVNPQYNFVDQGPFYQQLTDWNQLPFTVLSSPDAGPGTLSPDLRVFPALLFQILACALLVLPQETDSMFDALKYAGGMTFEDLAKDYSESGAAILALFGKKNVAVTTVQAGFLRSLFFKYTANVTESWHSISVAVKDAQEVGMHRDNLDPRPKDDSLGSVLENQWLIQRRRKMYLVLVVWDVSMAVFLGRPDGGAWIYGLPTLPIDAPEPADTRATPIVARGEGERPTLTTKNLWSFKISTALKDIIELERDGPHPKDFSKVDRVHQRLLHLEDSKPAAFRVENPDSRWDHEPEMHWLPGTRTYFNQLHYFSLLSLHRPYIFHRRESRAAALHASIEMLEVQRQSFGALSPSSWRNFNLFFGSFDALVVIASIYILFPQEHAEYRDNAIRHFHWTMERFTAMKERNYLARSAQDVLKAIQARFVRAVGPRDGSSVSREPSLTTTSSHPATTPESLRSESISGQTPGTGYAVSAANNMKMQSDGLSGQWEFGDWTIPSADSLAAMAPMYPTTDLVYNDLQAGGAFQFGGDFEQNTFWQFLNQFPAGAGE